MLRLLIPIKPKPKQSTRFNGKHSYTPSDVRKHADNLKGLIYAQLPTDFVMYKEPLIVSYRFYYTYPKTMSLKRRAVTVYRDSKPDLDNLMKGVNDAMNDLVYEDDSSIVKATVAKLYTDGDNRIEIVIHTVDEVIELAPN